MFRVLDQRYPSEARSASRDAWFPGVPVALRRREWLTLFRGHAIRVLTRGLFRAQLFVDDLCVDRRSPLLATNRRVPFLSGRLPSAETDVVIVEVYSTGRFARRIEVHVAGKRVATNLISDMS